jgi:Tfp pilus assembly protein PilW
LIYAGGVSIGPKADVDATVGALRIIYTALQVNMGKTQVLNEKVAVAKMNKLIDAVEAALKVSSETQFRFEDMNIKATRNDKTQYLTIGLSPHG